jgi:hypothetical protein
MPTVGGLARLRLILCVTSFQKEFRMASYKYASYLLQNSSDAFDEIFSPGTPAPWSGIYRCQACHLEAACNANQPLPPQNIHPHPEAIQWRLAVYAMHKA